MRAAVGRPGKLERRTRQSVSHLRVGIALTFVAVGLTALATTSAWWPADADVIADCPG